MVAHALCDVVAAGVAPAARAAGYNTVLVTGHAGSLTSGLLHDGNSVRAVANAVKREAAVLGGAVADVLRDGP